MSKDIDKLQWLICHKTQPNQTSGPECWYHLGSHLWLRKNCSIIYS